MVLNFQVSVTVCRSPGAGLTIQMKAFEQYFHVTLFIMLYKVVLTLKSVEEILLCTCPFIFKARRVKLLSLMSDVQ